MFLYYFLAFIIQTKTELLFFFLICFCKSLQSFNLHLARCRLKPNKISNKTLQGVAKTIQGDKKP